MDKIRYKNFKMYFKKAVTNLIELGQFPKMPEYEIVNLAHRLTVHEMEKNPKAKNKQNRKEVAN